MAVSAELQIIISAVNNAKAQITSLVKDLGGVTTGLNNINRTDVGKKQSEQLNNLGKSARSARSASDSMASFALKAGAVALAVKGLIALPEAYKSIDARLRIAADSQDDYNRSQKETTRIALTSRSSLEGVAGLYTKLKVNAGLASEDAAKLTEIIGKATQLDGGGAGADAAIFQLQQGLSSGTLRGEELYSVLEQTPSLAKALADGLGLSVDGLRALAAQGGLTAEVVKNSLFKMQGDIDSKFKQLPVTTGQAFENIKTQATLKLGSIDSQLGITQTIAEGMVAIADNIQPLLTIGLALGVVFVGLKAQALIAASGIFTLTGATAAYDAVLGVLLAPITLVVGAVAGLVALFTYAINETNALTETVAEPVTAFETLAAIFSLLGDVISNVFGMIAEGVGLLFDFGDSADTSGKQVEKSFLNQFGLVRRFFNFLINAVPAIGRLLITVGKSLGEGIMLYYKTLYNGTVAIFKDVQKVFSGDFSFTNSKKALSDAKKAGGEIASSFKEGYKDYRAIMDNDSVGDIIKAVNKRVNETRRNKPKTKTKTKISDTKAGKGNGTEAFGASDDDLKAIKSNLDAIIKDIKDTLTQASKAYEEAYKDNLIGIEDFYLARQTIVDKQADDEIQAQKDILAATQKARDKVANTSVTDKGAEKKRAKLADLDAEILKINENILGVEKERAISSVDIALNRERDLKSLRLEVAEIQLANDLISGIATSEQRADAIRIKNAELLKKAQQNEAQAPGATAAVQRKIEIEINQEVLNETEAKFNAVVTRLRNSQETVDIQRKNGILTETQAREKLVALNQEAATELDALIPKLEEAAKAIGPDAIAKVQGWKNEIAQTRTVIDETAVRINGSFKDAATTLFKDFVTGAKTAKEAVLDFASSFLASMAEIASQKLSENIFGGITGGSGGIGGFISGLFGTKPTGKTKGETPADPLYTADASAALPGLTDIADPTQPVLDNFFTSVKDGFNGLVDTGKGVFESIGGFLTKLFSSSGGAGGAGGGGGWGVLLQAGMSLLGFAEGGLISGAGTGTSDSIPIAASNGEFVTRASQTARWLPLLHAINSGSLDSVSPMKIPSRPYFAEGGLVDKASQAGNKTAGQQGSGGQNTRIVNVIDPAMAGEYLQSSAGEKVMMNFIGRNKSGIRSALG